MALLKPSANFDTVRFASSWLLSPKALFGLRALFSTYIFVTIVVKLAIEGSTSAEIAEHDFSYFTSLTFWGLAFYFAFAALHTGSYVFSRGHVPLLARWPAFLQQAHGFFYTTIATFPFLVTIVYWSLLAPSHFKSTFSLWSNVSQHVLNSVFAFCEITLTRTQPPPVPHLIGIVGILAMYLGLAYITVSTEHFYVYGFLDPTRHSKAVVVGYIIGILVAGIVLFLLVRTAIWLRARVTEEKLELTGKVYPRREGSGVGDADAEMGLVQVREKSGVHTNVRAMDGHQL